MKCVLQAKQWEQMACVGGCKRVPWLPMLVVSAPSRCELPQHPRGGPGGGGGVGELLSLPAYWRLVSRPLLCQSAQLCSAKDSASSPFAGLC